VDGGAVGTSHCAVVPTVSVTESNVWASGASGGICPIARWRRERAERRSAIQRYLMATQIRRGRDLQCGDGRHGTAARALRGWAGPGRQERRAVAGRGPSGASIRQSAGVAAAQAIVGHALERAIFLLSRRHPASSADRCPQPVTPAEPERPARALPGISSVPGDDRLGGK
jgi:hypothetical protein